MTGEPSENPCKHNVCRDCATDVTPCTHHRGCRHAGRWEWFMIHDDVWMQAGAGDGFLCVGCLERRLRRSLTPEDFPDLPINLPDPWDTLRLAARKSGLEEGALAGCWPPRAGARRVAPG